MLVPADVSYGLHVRGGIVAYGLHPLRPFKVRRVPGLEVCVVLKAKPAVKVCSRHVVK
jgi:hypothetical protein